MKLLIAPFELVVKHYHILWRTALVELKSSFAGSVLGMIWVVLGPILLLSLYSLVYAVIFRVRPTTMSMTEYILYVCTGLVPFIAFSMALTNGTLSLASNKHVLLNTVFPSELIPLRSVLVSSVSLVAGVVVLFLGDIFLGTPSVTVLLIPLVIVMQVMFITGVCWILSLLTLLVRDVQQILVYITILLLVVTPIAYTPDMIPDSLKILMYGNPLFYFVTSFQSLLVLNKVPPLHIVCIGTFLSLASFWIGFTVYHRAKQVFYDYA